MTGPGQFRDPWAGKKIEKEELPSAGIFGKLMIYLFTGGIGGAVGAFIMIWLSSRAQRVSRVVGSGSPASWEDIKGRLIAGIIIGAIIAIGATYGLMKEDDN